MDSQKDIIVEALLKAPTVISEPIQVWVDNEKELKASNRIGADNYYHRKAMCENAQKGYTDALVSLLLGAGKEVFDFMEKDESISETGTLSALDALKDGAKDMKNNLNGMKLGLQNPEKDCKILLQDLDWESNTWKKQSK